MVSKERMILLGSSALVLLILNAQVLRKEVAVRQGRPVYLELAPVDPRSLIQGDYMRLDYAITREASQALKSGRRATAIIARLNARGVATFVSLESDDHPRTLGRDEVRLRLKSRGEAAIGAESFLFQEGQAPVFERARYGEVRVSASGEVLLVNLCDPALKPLGPPRW